jgi:hypothetical protein
VDAIANVDCEIMVEEHKASTIWVGVLV